ncbi:unnamed protein product [Rhizophagus irregularis]|nr:unnamed protein product [Rhizophagus irregularis]
MIFSGYTFRFLGATFRFCMLLWEVAFDIITYRDLCYTNIIDHAKAGKRRGKMIQNFGLDSMNCLINYAETSFKRIHAANQKKCYDRFGQKAE